MPAWSSYTCRETSSQANIPVELGGLDSLQWLLLNDNALTGPVPVELGGLASLTGLLVHNNPDLAGPLPLALSSLSTLQMFRYDGTGLCVPADASFRAWLNAIASHRGTGVDCPDDGGNQSPVTAGTIPAATVQAGTSLSVNGSSYFSDPDGDVLTYTASSSSTGVATTSVSGATVTVAGVAEGSATIRITATDPDGLSAVQTFSVTVAASGGNRPPVTVGAIPARTLQPGGTATFDASGYFSDPDGDALAYAAAASNANVAGASVSGSTVTITAIAQGSATITVIATDPGGLAASQEARVTVSSGAPRTERDILEAFYNATGGPGWTNSTGWLTDAPLGDWHGVTTDSAGRVVGLHLQSNQLMGEIPAELGGLARLEQLYLQRNQLSGGIPAELSELASLRWLLLNHNALTGAVPGDLGGLAGLAGLLLNDNVGLAGPLPLTLSSLSALQMFRYDGTGLCVPADAAFRAWLNAIANHRGTGVDCPGGGGNQSPVAAGTIPAATMQAGASVSVNASSYFSDPDGDALTYTASSSSTGVATTSVSGPTVTVAGVAEGSATIRITATDPGGLSAVQTFSVTVTAGGGGNRPPVTVGALPVRTLEPGGAATFDASGYFSDPDGDALTYAASSSNANVAGASVSGSTVTITAIAQGSATITVTATDPGGLAAGQEARVTVSSGEPRTERDILEALYNATGGPGWTNSTGWLTDAPLGDWHGVTTDSAGRVVGLHLQSNRLTGEIPAELGRLAGLKQLYLQSNRLTGEIPVEFGGLASLQWLLLNDNALTGPAPVELGGLTDLAGLLLHNNMDLAGPLPLTLPWLSALSLFRYDGTGLCVPVVASFRAWLNAIASHRGTGVDCAFTSPVTVGTIPARTLDPGDTATVDASRYFGDPDGDALTYAAAASNSNVAWASVSGSTVTITAVAQGSATITVTATDPGGLTASQEASINVRQPNRAPQAAGTTPARTLDPGGTATVDASRYFSDPDGDALTYTAGSSNSNVARASVSGSTVTITAVARGSATITVTATDPGGLQAHRSFTVTVRNRAPTATVPIPDQTLDEGTSRALALSPHFEDPDGDPLTYTASTSNSRVATVSVSQSNVVTVRGVLGGEADITVTATDPDGAYAAQIFTVTVERPTMSFDIGLGFGPSVTASQEQVFRNAASYWESALRFTELADVAVNRTLRCSARGVTASVTIENLDDVGIVFAVADLDGERGTLAVARLCFVRSESRMPILGITVFDHADIDVLAQTGNLLETAVHEVAHILGFGLELWESRGLLQNPSEDNPTADTHFAGTRAIAAFDAAGGFSYDGAKVPVQNGGDDSHWRESVLDLELMTPALRLGERNPLSAITLESFADLGYSIDASQASSYRLPAAARIADNEAAAKVTPEIIHYGNDVERGPIRVLDSDGRVVGVIGNEAAIREPTGTVIHVILREDR